MLLESFSTNQWIILLLVLALGWLLGLLSSSGGRKWRRQYEAERDHRVTIERDRDARLSEAEARWHARDHTPVVRDDADRPITRDGVHRPGTL